MQAQAGKAIAAGDRRRDRIFVVVAAFAEQAAIGEVVRGLRAEFPRVVVVDDGSADATAAEARAAGATVLRHVVNRGQGAALQTGITWSLAAGAEIVVTCDADGQHRAEDVHRLVEPVLSGRVEVALGSRFLEHAGSVPRARRLLLGAAVLFTRLTSGVRLSDAHNGLRAFSRRVAERLDLRLDRMAHASEIIDQIRRLEASWVEVPVEVRYTAYSRAKGQRSSAALRIAAEYLLGRLLP